MKLNTTETMKVKEATVMIAGVEIHAYQLPDGSYRCSASQVLKAFSIDATNVARYINGLSTIQNKVVTKLKVSRSKDLSMIHRNSSYTTQSYLLTTLDLNQLLLNIALNGHPEAGALLVATATETWERRFDSAFGIKKTEVAYDATVANLYRRLRKEHQMQYIPYLTHWTKVDYPNGCEMNYKVRTNQLKRAAGFDDCVSVDDMSTEQLLRWNTAEVRYDAYRRAGYWHELAIKEVAFV